MAAESNNTSVYPSPEVRFYEIEDTLFLGTDWRLRASDHFKSYEHGESIQNYNAGLGALALAVAAENSVKSMVTTINELELMLQLPHYGPNN